MEYYCENMSFSQILPLRVFCFGTVLILVFVFIDINFIRTRYKLNYYMIHLLTSSRLSKLIYFSSFFVYKKMINLYYSSFLRHIQVVNC